MLNDLCNLEIKSEFTNALTRTLADYNPTANDFIINIMKNSVYAAGAALLTAFMLMELVVLINRADGGNGIGAIRLPANMMIKFGIFALLFTHIPQILAGIESVAVGIAGGMVASYDVGIGITAAQVSAMADAILDLGFIDRIFTYITLLICWLLVKLIKGIIEITVIFRMFELWIMLLLSPIPLATLASSEFRQTAISFLKSFVSTALRGSAIIACFVIYSALMSSFIGNYDPSMDIGEYMDGMLMNNIIYTLGLAIAVLNAGKIINRIMGTA